MPPSTTAGPIRRGCTATAGSPDSCSTPPAPRWPRASARCPRRSSSPRRAPRPLHAGVLGLARGRRKVGTTVVASAVEHSAVLRAADWVVPGQDPVLVPVNPHAEVEVKAFRRAVRAPGVALAAVQHVNHEVGTIQPLARGARGRPGRGGPAPGRRLRRARVACPATPHWDVLAGSAHKWGGPAGVGILAVRTGVRWRSPMPTDEAGRWAGFPDVPAAVAAATALEARHGGPGPDAGAPGPPADRSCASGCPGLRPGHPRRSGRHRARRRTSSASRSSTPTARCSSPSWTGPGSRSARARRAPSDTRRPSHVLAAMGAITHGNLRVSLPPDATEADVAGVPGRPAGGHRRRPGVGATERSS